MGLGAEILSGKTVNQTGLTAVTNATGDSTVVRSYQPGSQAFLLNAWALNGTAGQHRVRSPRMHDNVNAILNNVKASNGTPLWAEGTRQAIYSQDTLTVELSGGGAETDTESVLVYYQNVPGVDAQLSMWNDIIGRIQNFMTMTVAITSGTTLGDYVGSTALSAATGNFEANIQYALLGYETSVAVCSVGIRGQDTGNLRIGGPGSTIQIETRQWFRRISDQWQLPLIPVFNSANVGGILVDVVQNSANANPTVNLYFAQLAS